MSDFLEKHKAEIEKIINSYEKIPLIIISELFIAIFLSIKFNDFIFMGLGFFMMFISFFSLDLLIIKQKKSKTNNFINKNKDEIEAEIKKILERNYISIDKQKFLFDFLKSKEKEKYDMSDIIDIMREDDKENKNNLFIKEKNEFLGVNEIKYNKAKVAYY